VDCSVAAGETWMHASSVLAAGSDTIVDGLLSVIHDTPSEVQTLVLVGHNPSMAELAGSLDDGRGDAGARAELDRSYPTSGVAVFTVHTPWPQIEAGSATLTHFGAPHG